MRKTIAVLIAVASLPSLTTFAVAQNAPLRFEVASVKPTPPERQNLLQKEFCTTGGRFVVAGIPVMWSLTYAFQLKDYQISGAPAWLSEFASVYDIEAKPSQPVNEAECRRMLQSLFADRFKLAMHWEQKESAVYFLTVKNGTKLHEGAEVRLNGGVQLGASGKPEWADGWDMSALSKYLSNYTDRPVIDRTGLAGTYGESVWIFHSRMVMTAPVSLLRYRSNLG